jgi:hypothetical protein
MISPAHHAFELFFLEDGVGFLDEGVDGGRQGRPFVPFEDGSLREQGLGLLGKQLNGGQGLLLPLRALLALPVFVPGHSFHDANIIYF